MKKDLEKKFSLCLYIIIIILIINSIILLVISSKLNFNENNSSSNNTTITDTYDVSMFTSLKSSEVTKKIKNGEQFVLFIGYSNCTFCKKILPIMQQLQKDYNYETVYLDISKETVSSSEYREMASLLDIEKTVNGETKKFGEFEYTPMIAVIKSGKMFEGMIGYNTYENISSLLEKAGIKKK